MMSGGSDIPYDSVKEDLTSRVEMATLEKPITSEEIDETFLNEIGPFSASSNGWMRTWLQPQHRLKSAPRKEFKPRRYSNTFACSQDRQLHRLMRCLTNVRMACEANGSIVKIPQHLG